jgi:hypothetical protein
MKQGVPSIPPKRSTLATAVQPDYRKWEAVKVGMTRDQVTALLGPPLTGRERRPVVYFGGSRYTMYGFISYPASPHWWKMNFSVYYDENDRVGRKSDPFGGVRLSRAGKPTKPIIIMPAGNQFSHFPRLVDVRWYPCSGHYPLVYEMEIGLSRFRERVFGRYIEPHQIGQPYRLIVL